MTIEIAKSRPLSFQGEVIAVFERNARRVAKILIHPTALEVDVEKIPDAHLGDQVTLETQLILENIRPVVTGD